jgi:ATP-dependent Lhr-like helicase
MVWELFSQELQKLIKERGFSKPTSIQREGIPPIIKGKNTLLIAPTGVGKTESVLLPVFDEFVRKREALKPISILYITPLKSLNRDLLKRILWWSEKLNFEVSVRHGDTSQYERSMQAANPSDMFITTPETLQAMLVGARMREHLKNVRWIVVDEIHELVDNKRGVQLSVGLERLKEIISDKNKIQMVGLSATIGTPEKVAAFLTAGKPCTIINTFERGNIEVRVEAPKPEKHDSEIAEKLLVGPETSARLRRIAELIEKNRSVLAFTNTREFSEVLSSRLRLMSPKLPLETHHSSLSKDVRIEAEERFKQEKVKALVCVDKNSRILLSNGLWKKIKHMNGKSPSNVASIGKDLKIEESGVSGVVNNGKKASLKIVSKLGFELACTLDHKILTINNDGNLEWKEAGKFEIGQPIAIVRNVPSKGKENLFINIIPENLYITVSRGLIRKIKHLILEKYKTYASAAIKLNLTRGSIKSFLSDKSAIPLKRLRCILSGIGVDFIDILPEIENIGSSNYLRHKMPRYINPEFIRIIGFLLADGTITRNDMIRLFNKNEDLLKRYANILEKEFGIKVNFFEGPNVMVLQTHATWLCQTLERIGVLLGRKARKVHIPDLVFTLPEKHRQAFLAGYFDGDGNLEIEKNKIVSVVFRTYSKIMARDLQLLLLSLGMVSSFRDISNRDKGYAVAILGGLNIQKFVRGCIVWKRNLDHLLNMSGYSNLDCVPNLGIILRKLRKKTGLSTYYMIKNYELNPQKYELNTRNIGRKQLKRLIKIYSSKTEIPPLLKFLVNSDIFWDKVKIIDNSVTGDVYDITDVNKNQNFIANGFIVHNCTSSLELGIDIGSISLVLQYMSPRQVAKLLQRIGRAGHKVAEVSKGVVIATDPDDCFEASVIAKLGTESKIEPTAIYGKALDILGHQIVGLALEEYKIPFDKAYGIIKKAYPFRSLSKEEFFAVAKMMEKLGYIWVGSKFDDVVSLRRRKPAWLYYYQNLSTIPDTKNYKIIDVVSNKPVGTLDEEFVAIHGRAGTSFIVKGQAWRIIDVQESSLLVEMEQNPAAAIPAWEGELIPIPFEVAQEVGKLRRKIAGMLERGMEREATSEKLMSEYPVTRDVAGKMLREIAEQIKYGFVPDHENVLVEYWDGYVVLHTPFGSLVNETLGRVLTTLLIGKLGSVGLESDAYRIIIKLPGYQYQQVLDTFRALEPEAIQGILESSLPSNELFEWRFIHVAQRFGMIARNADYGKAYIKKIIDVYFKLPPYLEALNEIFEEKLDVETSKRVLQEIKAGKIKLHFRPGLSPLGEAGLSRRYEVISPEKPDKEIFKAFEKRLMDTKLGLVCTNCGEVVFHSSVGGVPEKIQCRKCEARLIGYAPYVYTSDAARLVRRHLRGEKLTREDEKRLRFVQDSASLILSHGKDALLCLAGRGVGVRTAVRILRKGVKDEALLAEILEAEKQFAKTKRFWKR